MRQVFHQQHQGAYNTGWDTAVKDMDDKSAKEVLSVFKIRYPPSFRASSLEEFYFVSGYFECVAERFVEEE